MPEQKIGRLTATGLEKRYPEGDGSLAVKGIDFDIAPGEFVTILGPSGCGKTTTLRMIAGFETPTGGDIALDGASILGIGPERRPMAMVFQSYALFPHLSVAENIAYGLRVRRVGRAEIARRVTDALRLTGLEEYASRMPGQLSGGQQQRTALARAIVVEPAVLLYDEPLSNLDAKLREQLRTQIRELQEQSGITSVFVTHDQHEAMTLSDRILVMQDGRIEQFDTPQRLYHRPLTPFVADFVGQGTRIEVDVADVRPEGTAIVSFAGRDYEVPAHPEIAPGCARALLLIRPESIELDRAPASEPARVTRTVFHGATLECRVTGSFGALTASISDPVSAPRTGDAVDARLRPHHAWLMPLPAP